MRNKKDKKVPMRSGGIQTRGMIKKGLTATINHPLPGELSAVRQRKKNKKFQ